MAGMSSMPSLSAAGADLGVNSQDTMEKTAAELAAMKRRKKVMGPNATPLGMASVMSLTGNQY